MTSMAAVKTIAGGLFNAFFFAGAGYLFSSFNKKGFEEETKRHNLATEELQKSKEKFYENETMRKDREKELRAKIYDAKSNMEDTSRAFDELNKLRQQNELPPPRLEDFYQPSDEMKKYQIAAAGLMGGACGLLFYKVL